MSLCWLCQSEGGKGKLRVRIGFVFDDCPWRGRVSYAVWMGYERERGRWKRHWDWGYCSPMRAQPGLIYIASHKLYLNGGRSQFVIISHAYSIYTMLYYIVYTISGLCLCTLRIISGPATKWPRSQSEWPNGRLPPTDNKFQVCSSNAHSPIAWVDKGKGGGADKLPR